MTTTKKKPNMFLEKLKVEEPPSREELEAGESVNRWEHTGTPITGKPINIGADFVGQENNGEVDALSTPPNEEYSETIFSDFAPNQPKEEFSFNAPDELIIAGIPMLVSAMMGNTGIGAGIAGNALVKREQDKQKMRAAASKNTATDKNVEVWNPISKRYEWGSANQSRGKGSPSTEKTVEAHKQRVANSDEAIQGRYEKLGRIDEGSKLNEVQWKKSKDLQSSFDKKTKPNLEEKRLLDKASAALSSDTNLGDRLGVMSLVKQIETRLSDQDRAYYTGQPSIFAEVHAQLTKVKTNREYQKVVNEAKKLVNQYLEKANEFDQTIVDQYKGRATGQGIPSGYINKNMFNLYSPKGMDEKKASSKNTITVTNGERTFQIQPSDLEAAKKDGYHAQ